VLTASLRERAEVALALAAESLGVQELAVRG